MKKTHTLMLSLIMILATVFGMTSRVVYAADLNSSVNEETMESDTYNNGALIETSWRTIATSNSGFNCNIYIECLNNTFLPNSWTVSPTDIRMLGKRGNVIWSESGAVAGLGNRTFWCGKDIYKIQARCQVGDGTIYIHQV